MRLGPMLDHCLSLERRAGDMYRRFAALAGPDDALYDTWTRMAAEEEEHAAEMEVAATAADPASAQRTIVDGWDAALADAEHVLDEAGAEESPSRDRQLALALDLERTEIDVLRRVVLALAHEDFAAARATSRHALELARVALRQSSDEGVQLKAALVRAHERLGLDATEPA